MGLKRDVSVLFTGGLQRSEMVFSEARTANIAESQVSVNKEFTHVMLHSSSKFATGKVVIPKMRLGGNYSNCTLPGDQ